MADVCGDNRFEIIEKAKQDLLESTNISSREDEMKVLDSFLFRCWQMGWLDKYDVEESTSEADCTTKDDDLEEASEEYAFNKFPSIGIPNTVIELAFKAGAEWQKQQMKESLQTEYEKGRFDMREEMMKNTVLETKVMKDSDGDGIETPYEEWLTLENTEIPYIPNNLGLKEGDKVKIIICKTE